MKRLFVCVVALLAAVGAIAQPEEAGLRKEISAYYAKLAAAMSNKDLKSMLALVDKGYVSVDTEGKAMDYVACRAEWKRMFASITSGKAEFKLKHVQLQTQEASAWVEMTGVITTMIGGKKTTRSFTSRFCDTLKRTATGWVATYSMELPTNEPWNFPTTGGGR